MKPSVPLKRRLQRVVFLCGLGLALGSCQERLEPERLPLSVAQPAAPPAVDERQRQFLEGLKQHPTPSPERTAFVQTQLKDARFSGTAAMHAWASGDTAIIDNAYGFLQNIEDLAIVPAVEQPLPNDAKAAAQALLLLGDAEPELRRKILRRLNALLNDTRELPAEPGLAGSPHRVCDEAYVTLRRLVAFPEPEYKGPFAAKSFFASATAARSALIRNVHSEPTWQRILDPNADIDDKPSKLTKPATHARPQFTPMQ